MLVVKASIALVFEHLVHLPAQSHLFSLYGLFEPQRLAPSFYLFIVMRISPIDRVSQYHDQLRLRDRLRRPSGSMGVKQIIRGGLPRDERALLVPAGQRELRPIPLDAPVEVAVEVVQ